MLRKINRLILISCYLSSLPQPMDDKETLQQLEKEAQRLATELKRQQQELWQLRQQIQQLRPVEQIPASKPLPSATSLRQVSLENLIGLRFIHLVGIVVLVIGLSLGVKYAIDKNLISEGMRIALAYAAGGILLLLSVQLKKGYAGFSAILFSGAMASIYFTTYAAFVYYHLVSFTVAFIIMIGLTIFTTYQAIVYNRQEISLLGLVGAYGIPFLISPNRGHAELLFLYISIINAGVVFLCVKKPWVFVGRSAQTITWVLFIGWAALQNDAGLKSYGLIYMALFFFSFFINALSGKLFRKEAISINATYQLVSNNIAIYIAALFVFGYTFANSTIAIITILFSLFALLQMLLFTVWKEQRAQLFLGYYGLLLFVVFIGFQWNGIIVTLLWLLTAVVLFIAGVRLKSIAMRLSAMALIGVTLLKLVVFDSLRFSTLQKVIAYILLGVLLLIVSFFYQKTSTRAGGGPTPQEGID